MNRIEVLKRALKFIEKGWAPELDFEGWCSSELGNLCGPEDAHRFSVEGALARAGAGVWPFALDDGVLEVLAGLCLPLSLREWLRLEGRTQDDVLQLFTKAIQRSKRENAR